MSDSLLPTYARSGLSFTHGKGARLYDEQGHEYIDCYSGVGVNSLGHANPDLVKVLTEQATKLWHVANIHEIPEQTALANALVDATFADKVFIANSGTESIELAIKMLRRYWFDKGQNKYEILTLSGAFHGRSTGAIAAGSCKLREGMGPLAPGFRMLSWQAMAEVENHVNDLTAGILIEPIQGEGGVRVIEDDMLRHIRDVCDKQGPLLILDEVQCGTFLPTNPLRLRLISWL